MKYLLLLIITLFTGCATLPKALEPIETKGEVKSRKIFIVSHGKHTGIIIEPTHLNALMPQLKTRFPNAIFYEIGWGDAAFYKADEVTTGLTLHAVFWPSKTVLHVTALDKDPVNYFPDSKIVPLFITENNYKNMLKFIKLSFTTKPTGEIILDGKGLYGNSEFFQGHGRYYLFNTCNKWIAKALYSGGIEISPTCIISSSDVMDELPQK